MNWFSENKIPLTQALVVSFILIVAIAAIIFLGDFRYVDTHSLLLMVVLICCILIAKNVFDNSRDALKLKKLNENLKNNDSITSKALYLELYQNSPVPYLVIDHTGYVHSANMSACRLIGVSQQKVKEI